MWKPIIWLDSKGLVFSPLLLLSRCLQPARIGFREIWDDIVLLDIWMLLPDI